MASALEEIERQGKLLESKRLRYSLSFPKHYHHWLNTVILELLAPSPAYRVLDCGCGTGILLRCLEKAYGSIVGLDLSIDNLREARILTRQASLLVGNIESLPLAPRSFDHVVCRAALHYHPKLCLAFQGIFDILREGGDLVIYEPINDSGLLRFLRVIRRHCTACTYTSEEWIKMAEAAGFRTVRWFHLGYLALPLLGYPESNRIMLYLPFRMPLARFLLRLDHLIAKIPWMKTHSWHAIFHFKKPLAPSSS